MFKEEGENTMKNFVICVITLSLLFVYSKDCIEISANIRNISGENVILVRQNIEHGFNYNFNLEGVIKNSPQLCHNKKENMEADIAKEDYSKISEQAVITTTEIIKTDDISYVPVLTQYPANQNNFMYDGKEVRAKVVSIAEAWLGCKESDGSHKKIIDVYNGHNPKARGYKVKYTDAWCATFVSAVAIKAELTDIIPLECSCNQFIRLARNMGIWVENDAYVPSAGDIILYDWHDSGFGDSTGWANHIGIVVDVSDSIIRVIEGNYEDEVKYRYIAVNGKYIRGFVTPKYDTVSSAFLQTASNYNNIGSTGSNKPSGNGGNISDTVSNQGLGSTGSSNTGGNENTDKIKEDTSLQSTQKTDKEAGEQTEMAIDSFEEEETTKNPNPPDISETEENTYETDIPDKNPDDTKEESEETTVDVNINDKESEKVKS